MDPKIRELLEGLAYRRHFPPREEILSIKATLQSRGFRESSTTMEMIAQKYGEEVAGLLEEFVERLLRNADSLGLRSPEQIHDVMTQASHQVIAQAQDALNQDVSEFHADFQTMARAHFTEGIADLQEHLTSKVALRDRG